MTFHISGEFTLSKQLFILTVLILLFRYISKHSRFAINLHEQMSYIYSKCYYCKRALIFVNDLGQRQHHFSIGEYYFK